MIESIVAFLLVALYVYVIGAGVLFFLLFSFNANREICCLAFLWPVFILLALWFLFTKTIKPAYQRLTRGL